MRATSYEPSADRARRTATRRAVAIGLSAALGVSVLLTLLRDKIGEQRVYALAAERFLDHEAVYRPNEPHAFTYPPFCILTYAPLLPLEDFGRRLVWYFLNCTALGLSVILVTRAVGPFVAPPGTGTEDRLGAKRRVRRWTVFLALLLALSARFLMSPIEYQGHDLLLLLLVTAAATLPGERTAGAAAGLAAAVKATPLLFLPVLLWQRRGRAATALVLAGVAATVLPDLIAPEPYGRWWIEAWYDAFVAHVRPGETAQATNVWFPWNLLNQSLTGTLYRLGTPIAGEPTPVLFDISLAAVPPAVLKGLTLLLQGAVLLAVTWGTRPLPGRLPADERTFMRLGQAGLVLCGMLLLSPMSSKQHFCVLLIPFAFCLTDFLFRSRSKVVGTLLVVVFLATTVGAKDVIGRTWGHLLLAYGVLTWSTVLCLAASLSVLRARRRIAEVTFVPPVTALLTDGSRHVDPVCKSHAAPITIPARSVECVLQD